jgi:hypothetical protein
MRSSRFQNSIPMSELTYERLQEILVHLLAETGLADQRIQVSARTLTPVEAIGDPQRKDFPLVKGREVMLEATLNGAIGQAFTDMPTTFEGQLKKVSEMSLSDNAQRGVFIATLNAVLRSQGWVDKTIHCKNEEPEDCANKLPQYVQQYVAEPRIAFIGLQPAMVDHLSRHYPIRVTDMDEDNVGTERYGVLIEPVEKTPEMIDWSNIVLATGSTVINNTYRSLLRDKPVIFYGVSVTGVAYLTDCGHYCYCGK